MMPINQEFLQSDTNNHVIYNAEFLGEAIKHKIPKILILPTKGGILHTPSYN